MAAALPALRRGKREGLQALIRPRGAVLQRDEGSSSCCSNSLRLQQARLCAAPHHYTPCPPLFLHRTDSRRCRRCARRQLPGRICLAPPLTPHLPTFLAPIKHPLAPQIRAAAAARGVDPGRILFTDVAPKELHIRRSGLADVFLDTPLCNAHTTGCDVLWGGCPMVTLPLERMASRVAASLACATGLGDEMVVSSQAEYEERAVELGLDHAQRHALRARLEALRDSCPLFDAPRWVRDLERVFLKMWDIHVEGGGPRSFNISD